MPWDAQLPSLFLGAFFVSHPAEEKRAFEWLADLRRRGIGWQAVRKQLEDFMLRNTEGGKPANAEHQQYIESQVRRAETLFKPWLLD